MFLDFPALYTQLIVLEDITGIYKKGLCDERCKVYMQSVY